jgi:Zn-dependent protease
MGPAICVGPVILAYLIAALPYDYALPMPVRQFLWSFATLGGALNFFNLLPFWPLDGGRMTHVLAWIYWKGAARVITIMMSGLFVAWALWSGHLILFLFALLGAQSLTHGETLTRIQRPMSKRRGLLASAAYLCVTVIHFWVGYYFVMGMLLR